VLEKDVLCKWKQKVSRNSYTHIKAILNYKTIKRWSLCIERRSNQQEHITIINIYEFNVGPPKYIRQILLDIKEEIDNNR
jgi:hypothetical protein